MGIIKLSADSPKVGRLSESNMFNIWPPIESPKRELADGNLFWGSFNTGAWSFRGRGAQKVLDLRFSHFVAPLPIINDQSLIDQLFSFDVNIVYILWQMTEESQITHTNRSIDWSPYAIFDTYFLWKTPPYILWESRPFMNLKVWKERH